MCPIRLEFEDILTIQADVCVSSLHRGKDMTMGTLSKHILDCGGQSIQDHLYKKELDKELKIGQVVTDVSPGKLKNCQELMFICLRSFKPGNEAILFNSILEILELAEIKNHRSISFPALGVGQGYPREIVASCLIDAVALYNYQYPKSLLDTVHIVLLSEDIDSIRTFLLMCARGTTDLHEDRREDAADLMPELLLGGAHNIYDPIQAKPTYRKESGTPRVPSQQRTRQQQNNNHHSKLSGLLQSVRSLINKQGVSFNVHNVSVNVKPSLSKNMVGFELKVGVSIEFLQKFIPDSLKSFWNEVSKH